MNEKKSSIVDDALDFWFYGGALLGTLILISEEQVSQVSLRNPASLAPLARSLHALYKISNSNPRQFRGAAALEIEKLLR